MCVAALTRFDHACVRQVVALPPRRQSERRPPLVTWPNYDLKSTFAMDVRKKTLSPTEVISRRVVHRQRDTASVTAVDVAPLI